MNQKTLEDVIKTVRVSVVADVCGVSQRAIYKWMDNGKLPRTEYTGETNYAEKIAHASNGLFSADAILTIGRNKTTTKKGNDSNLLIVFYVQIMPDDFVMQLHRF